MAVKKEVRQNKELSQEYEPNHDAQTLKKKIKFLEEELLRKDKAIDELRKENALLFKTAVKNSESKVDSRSARGQ